MSTEPSWNLDQLADAIREDLDAVATLESPQMFGPEPWRLVAALRSNTDALVAEIRRLRGEVSS